MFNSNLSMQCIEILKDFDIPELNKFRHMLENYSDLIKDGRNYSSVARCVIYAATNKNYDEFYFEALKKTSLVLDENNIKTIGMAKVVIYEAMEHVQQEQKQMIDKLTDLGYNRNRN